MTGKVLSKPKAVETNRYIRSDKSYNDYEGFTKYMLRKPMMRTNRPCENSSQFQRARRNPFGAYSTSSLVQTATPQPDRRSCQCWHSQLISIRPQCSVASNGARQIETKTFESRSSRRWNQLFSSSASLRLKGNSTAPIRKAHSRGRTKGPRIMQTATKAAMPAAIRKLYIAARKLSWFWERILSSRLRTLSKERSRLMGMDSERFMSR